MSSDLRLAYCDKDAAKYACQRWHYTGNVPKGRKVYVGVWEGGRFIGAVVFSNGAAGVGNYGKHFGGASTVCELCRVALSHDHKAPVSRIVSIAVKLLRRACPNIELVVSYADPAFGHLGTIYQAAGWTYTGMSAKTSCYVDKRGRLYHRRSVSPSGVNLQFGARKVCPKISDLRECRLPGKHRYMLPLSDRARNLVETLKQPYPKRVTRAESADSGTPVSNGRGLCDETSALHSNTNGQ